MTKITKQITEQNLAMIAKCIEKGQLVKYYTNDSFSYGKFVDLKDAKDLLVKGFVRFASKAWIKDNGEIVRTKIVLVNTIVSIKIS